MHYTVHLKAVSQIVFLQSTILSSAGQGLQYYNDKFKSLYSYTDSDLELGVHFSELGKIDLQNGNVVLTARFCI